MLAGEIAAGNWECLAPAVRDELFQEAFGWSVEDSSAAGRVAQVCEALVRRWGCASIEHLGDRLSIRLDSASVFHAVTGSGVGANPSLQLALMELALASLGQRPGDLTSRSRMAVRGSAQEAETLHGCDLHAAAFALPREFSREWANGNHDKSLALKYGIPEARLLKFTRAAGEARQRQVPSNEHMRSLAQVAVKKLKAAARERHREKIVELVQSNPGISRKAMQRIAQYSMTWMRANDSSFLDQVLPARVCLTKFTPESQRLEILTRARGALMQASERLKTTRREAIRRAEMSAFRLVQLHDRPWLERQFPPAAVQRAEAKRLEYKVANRAFALSGMNQAFDQPALCQVHS
jgi:hypothetical protein